MSLPKCIVHPSALQCLPLLVEVFLLPGECLNSNTRKKGGDLHLEHSNAGLYLLSTVLPPTVTQFDMTNKSHFASTSRS